VRVERTAARVISVGLAAHSVINARQLRRPPAADDALLAGEWISVLLPARDEEHRLLPALRALTSQVGLNAAAGVEFLVLDDASRDGTAALVDAVAGHEPRLRLVRGTGEPPAGHLGKSWACTRLVEAADPRATVFVFLDADVVLAPDALTRTVTLLRSAELDLVSPYPRQLAATAAERLLQPLLQWSWLTMVPLRVAERSSRPSLALANGQLLTVDAACYREAGGHAAEPVRAAVLEDLALARHLHRRGARGAFVDGTALATCRMYEGWHELRDGYAKSLWAAGGGHIGGTLGQLGLLGWLYLRPDPVCYAAGVVSRLVTARTTGGRGWPDALAHPASIGLLSALTVRSWYGRLTGSLTWKGRSIGPTVVSAPSR
jgi:GT2 family glycosyltransferase